MNFQTDRPIYLQVIDDIKRRMLRGELNTGQKLPSTRELAKEYQINPNTASRVYREMERAGLCFTQRGTGTFVTTDEQIWKLLRSDTAKESLTAFCRQMISLGISEEETIELIQTYYRQVREE